MAQLPQPLDVTAQSAPLPSTYVKWDSDPNIRIRDVCAQWVGEGEERYLDIQYPANGFTEEEKELIGYWFPLLVGQPSPYITSGNRVVSCAEDVLNHARGVMQEQSKAEREQRKQSKELSKEEHDAFVKAHEEWLAECTARKAAIKAAHADWRERVAQREAAIAGWNLYVRQAREAVQVLKDTPAPPRPVKP